MNVKELYIIKQMIADGILTQEVAAKYCPELIESEDERIMKKIIATIHLYYGEPLEDEAKEIIAWLEKQREQKSKKVSLWKHWKDGIAGNGEDKLIYLVKADDTYRLTSCLGFECDYIELSKLDKLLSEKQGEQQDVNIQINPSEYINNMGGNGCYLKNTTQASAWSEEDEKILNSLISSLARIGASTRTDSTSINYTFSKEIDWLKALKERVGCEVDCTTTKEWSEEDEKEYRRVEFAIMKVFGGDAFLIGWIRKFKNRLLYQSTWKPSGEQMKFLWKYAEQNNYDGRVLTSLYQDLKKLRGE